ncbi:MAG: tetratricopeptide repeat protein, partial [Streptomycetaceae bacterium]|nr:tetratricopeptide repeat protein [Streptomycetaceae bacterium]
NASATLTRPGAVLGTPAYMSPEQANGNEADIRSDLYSVGCLLYELLTGMPPFGFGEVAGLLFRQVHVPAESPSRARDDLPDAFCDLILALLAKNPDDRPQTAAEVRDLLEALPPVQALPRQVDREAEERLRRRAELARRVAEVSNLQPPEAVALLRELLPAHNREFGHDHGRTLRVRDDLANYLGMSGRRGVAVRMLRQVVLDYGRVLGARHPDTLGARRNLAYWTAKDGDPATAATLLRDLLPDFAPEHGPRDVETLSVRRELALYTGRSGEVEEAVRLLRELVPDLTDALGGDHPRTVEALEELAYWERRATPTRRTG